MGPTGEPVDGAGFDVKTFVNVHRLIWISKDIKLFGADYGADILVPVFHVDLEVNTPLGKYDDTNWGLGDIVVEPFVLSWHGARYDLSTAVCLFLPTGSHCAPSDPGEDMYTTMFTLGGTYYLDKAKTWSASILGRYEIHHNDLRETDITPGDDFHFEWGIAKTLANVWDVGLVGYCQWQVEHDHGTGASEGLDEGFGIGPEVSMSCPELKTFFSLRSEWEFGCEGAGAMDGRPEGNRTFLVITKIF